MVSGGSQFVLQENMIRSGMWDVNGHPRLGDFSFVNSSFLNLFSLVKEVKPKEEVRSCLICLQEERDLKASSCSCAAFFHEGCLLRWKQVQQSCPACRNTIWLFCYFITIFVLLLWKCPSFLFANIVLII